MERHDFHHGGLRLSYLDPGGVGRVLIALHAHFMEALTFAPLAAVLAPEWRVLALDQRGHGYSDHAPSYARDDYIGDLEAFFQHLGLSDVVLLGNSLGGVNAYQFAARHPAKVRGLIIEDIGAEVSDDLSFVLAWEGQFATREALSERVGPRLLPYLQDSFRKTPTGWRVAFDPREIVASGRCLSGDHWGDWLTTECPALLIRGRDSRVTTQASVEQMASRRPNTRLEMLEGGHIIHVDNPTAFANVVKQFLQELQNGSGEPRRAP
jgi:pimeloyl-ACP methyl ester carboxylesterase